MFRTVLAFAVVFVWLGVAISDCPAQTPVISTTGPELYPRQPSFKLLNQLTRRVNFDGFDDPRMTLYDALLALQKSYNITLELNEQAFKRDTALTGLLQQRVACKPIPPMKDVPLAEVLLAVLARISVAPHATYVINYDCVEITTRRQAILEGWEAYRSASTIYAYRLESARVTDLDRYGMEAVRIVGELVYWNHVMSENAKVVAAEAKPPQGPSSPQR